MVWEGGEGRGGGGAYAALQTTLLHIKLLCGSGRTSPHSSSSADYISFPLGSLGPLWYIRKWSSVHVYAGGRRQC